MKRLVLAFMLLMFASAAHAQGRLIPRLGDEDASLQLWGWTWTTYDTETEEFEPLAMWRVRGNVATDTPYSAFFELDLTDGLGSETNWLRQLYVSYRDPSGEYDLKAGRLFLAAPYATQPPFLLRTARFERFPFSYFGTGVQYHTAQGPWEITADLTGAYGTRFDEDRQFDTLSTSGRVTYDLSERLETGGFWQVSEDFTGGGLEVTWNPNEQHVVNGIIYHSDGAVERTGQLLFYGYRPDERLEFHVLFDRQDQAADELEIYPGVRIIVSRFQVVVDHEITEGETYARFTFTY